MAYGRLSAMEPVDHGIFRGPQCFCCPVQSCRAVRGAGVAVRLTAVRVLLRLGLSALARMNRTRGLASLAGSCGLLIALMSSWRTLAYMSAMSARLCSASTAVLGSAVKVEGVSTAPCSLHVVVGLAGCVTA